MPAVITHSFVSTVPDSSDTSLVRPSNWNDEHVVALDVSLSELSALTTNSLLLGSSASSTAVSEIILGTNLSMSANTLNGPSLTGYVPYTGATQDVNLGVYGLIAHRVQADASDGLLIEAGNGTDVGILGSGNTANVTWYGNHNFNAQTENTLAYFGASKTLSSLTAGTTGNLIRQGTSGPEWTSLVYPNSASPGQILYCSSVGVIGALNSGPSGVLITDSGWMPQISNTLPSAVQLNITSLGTITAGVWHGTAISLSSYASGTLQAAQFPALTGDVTTSAGSLATTIANNAVTYAKMQAVSTTSKLLGSSSTTTPVQEITIGSGLSLSGTTLTSTGLGGTVTSVEVSGANGIGVSGSPITSSGTIALSLGTITGATWQATKIGLLYGGTNANLTASNGGIVYSDASALAILSGTVTANKMLLSGSSAAPSWSTSTIPSSAGAVANKILLSDGTNYVLSTPTFPNVSATSGKLIRSDGTNWAASTFTIPDTYTTGDIIQASATNVFSSLAAVATGNVLISGGVGTVSSWGKVGLTTHVSGTLGVGNGGTGTATAFTQGSVVYAGASGVYSQDNSNFYWDGTNLGIGTATPNFASWSRCITVLAALDPALELASSRADADGVTIGDIEVNYRTNSATYQRVAQIKFQTDGSTTNQRGGRIMFYTRQDASASYLERMRIAGTGNVSIGSSTTTSLFNVGSSAQFQVNSTGQIGIGGAPSTTAGINNYTTSTTTYGLYQSGSISGSATTYWMRNDSTYAPLTGNNAYGIVYTPTITSPTSGTLSTAPAILISPTFNGSGTITQVIGLYVDSGTQSSGTITTGYGIRVGAIAYGTTRYSIYTTAPTGGTNNYGAFIGGNAFVNYTPNAVVQFGITAETSSKAYGIHVNGSLTKSSSWMYGMFSAVTYTPTNNNRVYGYYDSSTFTTPSGGFTDAASAYFDPIFNGSGTASTGACVIAGSGQSTTTVTTGYGFWSKALGFGTTRYAAYFEAPTGGTNNYGAYIGGVSGFNRTPQSTIQVGITAANQYGLYMDGTLATANASHYALLLQTTSTPTSNSYNSYSASLRPTFTSGASGINATFGAAISPTFSGSGTITQYTGLYIDVGSLSGTTLTTAYGIKVDALAIGTTRYGLHITAPTGGTTNYGALFAGGVVVLQNAALATNATTGFTYIPTCAGTPTGAPTAYTGTVPMVYDTTNNKFYVYNGAWKSVTLT